ncbi:MAG: BamA/TamA family outer membrane protein [Bacteroidetes bacterium]|nr:BamA/TamA family outer membrane protein [Bacteroidota bacterium]
MIFLQETKCCIIIFFYFINYNINALPIHSDQDTSQNDKKSFIIKEIITLGNKRTKDLIILRELNFSAGDTLTEGSIDQILEINRNNIFNTSLFVTVELSAQRRVHSDEKRLPGNEGRLENNEFINIIIIVKERWYTFPIPILELADRNFNVWWDEQNKDLDRIEYGIRFYQENCRGRNERLKVVLQSGFTRKYEIYYNIPYIDKKQIIGMRPSISYSRNREIAYKTGDTVKAFENKLVFYEDPEFIRERFNAGVKLFRRKAIHIIHSLDIKFNYNTIADTVAALNPNYFNNKGDHEQKYFQVSYAYKRDFRDIQYYPLKGSYLVFEAKKLGTGIFNDINQLELTTGYSKFWDVGKKTYLAGLIKTKNSIPKIQPWFNSRAFGYYQDFVRGYEFYVIDGQHYLLGKATLKKQLFSTTKELKTLIPIRQFQTIPFALYLKVYTDAGYVVNNSFTKENNPLTNSFLLGGGIGLDIVTFYDTVFRIEYSVNGRGEHGFYLHFEADI